MIKNAALTIFIFFYLFNTNSVKAISSFSKYSGNPILINGQNPTIVYKDNEYKMWFDVNVNGGWKINYAHSSDGINNWIVENEYIIEPGSFDNFEMDMANPSVIFDETNNIYKMWYTSVGFNWLGGDDRFRLGYATSIDGVNWSKYDGWVLKGASGMWDSGGIARGVSVSKINDIYHLWYTATNAGWSWKIGYAVSNDGIHWNKLNNGNPVIFPTTQWELANVSYPNVLKSDNGFEMFYTSGSNDMTTQIIYAYSEDGINWVKPQMSNPVLIPDQNIYDNLYMTSPFVLKNSDGSFKLWYSGNVTNIMYATENYKPTPTITPTQPKKIVIIPGMGGSWNSDAILGCTKNEESNGWAMSPFAAPEVYNPLLDKLRADGYDPTFYSYDWRQEIPANGLLFKKFLNEKFPNKHVNVIGHSMGGLVGRSYLEQTSDENTIANLLMVGSPHNGTALAYPAWSGGEIWSEDLMIRIGMTTLMKWCGIKGWKSDKDTLREQIPSVQNLLPRQPYLSREIFGILTPVISMNEINNWAQDSAFTNPYFGTRLGTLTGSGIETVSGMKVKMPNKHQAANGYWLDGNPIRSLYTTDGDGTVVQSSGTLTGITNYMLTTDHTGIINSSDAIHKIYEFFDLQKTNSIPNPTAAENTALVLISYPGEVTLSDPYGMTRTSTSGIVGIINPKPGKYDFTVNSLSDSSRIAVLQFLPDNRTKWKEIGTIGKGIKRGTVDFDESASLPDLILQQ